jgi:hypothetical protein
MKPHHAAALALVMLIGCASGSSTEPTGWLMVAPPQTGNFVHPKVDANAPLSSWSRPLGSNLFVFPSKEYCEQSLDYLHRQNQREGSPPAADSGLAMAQCVSIDDPRLKPK